MNFRYRFSPWRIAATRCLRLDPRDEAYLLPNPPRPSTPHSRHSVFYFGARRVSPRPRKIDEAAAPPPPVCGSTISASNKPVRLKQCAVDFDCHPVAGCARPTMSSPPPRAPTIPAFVLPSRSPIVYLSVSSQSLSTGAKNLWPFMSSLLCYLTDRHRHFTNHFRNILALFPPCVSFARWGDDFLAAVSLLA